LDETNDRRRPQRWEVDAAEFQGAIRANQKALEELLRRTDAELRLNISDLYERVNKLDREFAAHQEHCRGCQKSIDKLEAGAEKLKDGAGKAAIDVSNLKLIAAGIGALAGAVVGIVVSLVFRGLVAATAAAANPTLPK
jgi:chromosome segregation ATPase